MRGTFGNIRLRNALARGKEGNWTEYLPTGEVTSIYEAAMAYQAAGIPLVVLAGALYGKRIEPRLGRQGHAAAGRAGGHRQVVRAHPPRQPRGHGRPAAPVPRGRGRDELGLTGRETFDIRLAGLVPARGADVGFTREDGTTGSFQALARIDGPTDLHYLENGGILPTVLRRLYQESTCP